MHTDGSCPANPGPMGIGIVLDVAPDHDGGTGFRHAQGYQLGPGTNNKAEYLALIEGMREALRLGVTHIEMLSDSQLVVNQVCGSWKVKDHSLKHLCDEAQALMCLFTEATLRHAPREENTLADHYSKTPTDPAALPPDAELDIHPPHPRKLSRFDAARVQLWWQKRVCQNEYRLARIFYGTPSHMGRIGRREQYKDLTERDLHHG